MRVELRPASALTYAELAELFTAAYEGYAVPFAVDEDTFGFMVDVFDLDLAESLVAFEERTPVGLANLGRRGTRTWLGGVGVIAARRRAGIGEELTRGLLDRARTLGASEMVLEVIVENGPALSLYEKLGFVRTRELEVLSLAGAEPRGADSADVAPLDAARALVRSYRDSAEPWQRDDDTVDRLSGRDPAPHGLVADGAAAIYRVAGETVNLVQAAGDEHGLAAIVTTLCGRGTVSAVNYPARGAVSRALRAAGARVALRQHEMVKRLG